MALIPGFFFNSVVSIGIKSYDAVTQWIGTGFLVGRKEHSSDLYTIFLITNYHLIESKNKILLRFNKQEENKYRDCEIILSKNKKPLYSRHPQADVIAMQLSPSYLDKNKLDYSWFSLDEHSLTLSQMKETDVIEGCLVYSLGYPLNLIGSDRNIPICRLGCISRISDLFFSNINEYLVDIQTIPGNSGSPIINRPENSYIQGTSNNSSANLIGIISGTIDYSEKSNDKISEYEQEKNSGFAIVHTVDTIKEVVDMEYSRVKEMQK